MLRDPSKIAFEDTLDIVDYVTKGFVPRKKHMNEIVDAIMAYSNDEAVANKAGKETVIHRDVTEQLVRGDVSIEQIVERIYDNRRKNRNYVISVGAGILIAMLILNHQDKKKHEPTLGELIDNEFDRLNARIDAMEMADCM